MDIALIFGLNKIKNSLLLQKSRYGIISDMLEKFIDRDEAETGAQSIKEREKNEAALTRALQSHVVDVKPAEVGRRELVRAMGSVSVGASEAVIDRPHPPLEIERATATRGTLKVMIGPNGSGKSTVFDAFMERGAHVNTESGRGAVVFGKSIHARELLRIARLDQEEMLTGVKNLPAGAVLERAVQHFKSQFRVDWDDPERFEENMGNQEAAQRIEELGTQLLDLFDMKEFLARPVRELSGGERTKLALFMVLASEPDVLLLDEPTNHLDLRSIAKLTGLFEKYKRAGAAVVSVSHVDWFLREAGEDGVMEITWDGRGRRLHESNAPYARYAKNASRERTPVITGDIAWVQEGHDYQRGKLVVWGPDRCTIPNSPLIDVSVPTIQGGEVAVISGDNGSGKTKLLETMKTNTRPDLPKAEKGVHLAYLPQIWPAHVVAGTIRDFFYWIKKSTNPHGTGSSHHKDQNPETFFINQARDLNFGGTKASSSWLQKPLRKLSGGEQRLLWFLAVSSVRDVEC